MPAVTAVKMDESARDGSAAREFKKASHATGEGDRYEERVLALVFLRCLRDRLDFQLSANNRDADKFNDVVLMWGPEGHRLLVQLKHKTSVRSSKITIGDLLSKDPSAPFGLRKYCTSYALETDILVLSTNARLGRSSLDIFECPNVDSVPGLDLLRTGGNLYKLKLNNEQLPEEVQKNTSFLKQFHLLCNQSNSDEILNDIHVVLEELLGAGDLCGYICDSLCKSVREWMNKERVHLSSDWSRWQALVDEYVRKHVTACKVLTTRVRYCNVKDIHEHMQSWNPAWMTPPESGTVTLTATKIHQALDGQTHIMVDVGQFRRLRGQILCCWGPFCRWLVIVDDDREGNSEILDELVNQIDTEHRLVIVSSKGNNCFQDKCNSSDVSDGSWEELLDVCVRLNGNRYKCRLRDLVAGVDGLKLLLDGKAALLLAMAQLSQQTTCGECCRPSLRMGRELETLPSYYIPRKLVDRRLVPADFFKSLGFRDVCVIDKVYYKPLKHQIGTHSVTNFEKLRSWILTPFKFEWPLFVLTDEMETARKEFRSWAPLNIYMLQISPKSWAPLNMYMLQVSDDGWQIRYFSGQPYSIRDHATEQEKEQLEVLDAASNVVIVEGKPGVGKSKMLSHLAEQIKTKDCARWVLRVNLSEFYTVLDQRVSGESAMEDILKATLFNSGELGRLEYALLRHSLQHSRQVVCLVDGFDEVCPDYDSKCLEVLTLLEKQQGKLVVTTRPGRSKLLEARMGVLAHSLKPFSDSELEQFFARRPLMGNIPTKSLRDLLKIPLFAEMFADLSQENGDADDVVTLYEEFFKNKFRRFYERRGDNLSTPGRNRELEEERKRHEQQLMDLAALVLLHRIFRLYEEKRDASFAAPGRKKEFGKDQKRFDEQSTVLAEWVLSRRKDLLTKLAGDRDYFFQYGIVSNVADSEPAFVHRTFAEHFLANWCFLGDGEQYRPAVYREAYLDGTLDFFLESFNRRAVKDRPLLEALLKGDEDKMEALLAEDGAPRQTDACGRNALHIVATLDEQRSLPLLRQLLRHAGEAMLSAKDVLLGWTPMRYAAEGRHWITVKKLLEMGGDLSHLEDFRAGLHDPSKLEAIFKRGGYKALYQHINEVKHPIEKGIAQHMEFAVSLISAKMPRECLGQIAKNAWEEGHTLVCHLLLRAHCTMEEEEMGFLPKVVKQLGEFSFLTSLRNLVIGEEPQSDHAEVFTKRQSNSSSPSCASDLPDGGASGSGHRGPHYKHWADNDETDTYLSLHYCAASGNSCKLRELINLGKDVDLDERDMLGCTALHYAAAYGCTECIEVLVGAGVDVHAKCYDGSTALHFAARRGYDDSVRLLLEKKSDANGKNSEGDTPLICAQKSGNPECVRLLQHAGAMHK